MVEFDYPNGLLLCVSGSLYPHQGYLKNLPARRRQFV